MTSAHPLRRTEAERKPFYHRIESVVIDLNEYTENTTIHGVRYLAQKERPLIEKLYWIVIFIFCFVFLGIFMKEIVTKWEEHMVIVVEDDMPTPVFKIPFPAVTICPQIKVKVNEFSYEKYHEFDQTNQPNGAAYIAYIDKFKVAQQICHYATTQHFANRLPEHFLNRSHIDLLHQMSPSHYDIFERMEMPNSCRNYNSSFPEIIENFAHILTNEGLCYTFNLPAEILKNETLQVEYAYHNLTHTSDGWNYGTGYTANSTFPRRSCSAGEVSSLRIDLVGSVPDLDSLCQPTKVGYKIILHSPAVYPTTFETYISVSHESLVKIGVIPKMIKTSQRLRGLTVHQRQCYFDDERELQFFRFYNRINCKLECFANYTLQHYNCVHFAFPRGPQVPICGAHLNFLHMYEMVDSLDSLINYLDDFPDEHDVTDFVANAEAALSFTCDCLPDCNSIEYAYTIRTEDFRYEKLHAAIERVWNESDARLYAPASVQIYWKEPTFKGKTRKQYYTFSDLVSNFGGLLGLFMGASILSFFEIIYYCVLRQMAKCT